MRACRKDEGKKAEEGKKERRERIWRKKKRKRRKKGGGILHGRYVREGRNERGTR